MAKTYSGNNSLLALMRIVKTALSTKIPTSAKGTANGVAPLGADGTVPSEYLPGYVDDVIEMKKVAGDAEGETKWVVVDPDEGVTATEVDFTKGKIYLDVDANLSYRWGGTELVLITSSDLVEMTADEIQNMWDSIEVTANEGDENA